MSAAPARPQQARTEGKAEASPVSTARPTLSARHGSAQQQRTAPHGDRLRTHLSEVETLLADMADLLVRGDAPRFEMAATHLRRAMLELAHASACADWNDPSNADLGERLQRVQHALVRQRDNLARRAVVSQRSLAAVLPQPSVTYGAPGRPGLFRSTTARIYLTPAS